MTAPTPSDLSRAAYAQGVADVLALARQIADELEARTDRPLSIGFAVEALRALAEEATALIASPHSRPPEGRR